MKSRVAVDQLLFGYDAGHRRLAASVQLTREDEQLVLLASDLSGPSLADGFDSYLTGFDLVESGYYALCRTWYANEMPRAGCVWSHVLLVRHADVAVLEDMAAFNALFSRPSPRLSHDQYSTALSLIADEQKPSPRMEPERGDSSRILELLHVLYREPTKCVFLLSESAAEVESTVIGIWSQQWPALRLRFRFSTGSLQDRRVLGIPFDLQVVPASTSLHWRHRLDSANSTIVGQHGRQVAAAGWLTTLRDDILRPGRDFRGFCQSVGGDGGREYMEVVARLYREVQESWQSIDELVVFLERLASDGERRDLARRLTRWLMEHSGTAGDELSEREVLALSAAVILGDDAVVPSDLEVAEKSHVLWKNKRETTVSLLSHVADHPSGIGTRFAAGVAAQLSTQELLDMAGVNATAARAIVLAQPDLACRGELWKLTAIRHSLCVALESTNTGCDDPVSVVSILFDTADPESAQAVLRRFGDRGVWAVLDAAVEATAGRSMARAWLAPLRDRSAVIAEWLLSTPEASLPQAVEAVADVLDLSSVAKSRCSEIATIIARSCSGPTACTTMSACLALSAALRAGDIRVTRIVFPIVYQAAERGKLQEHAKRWLDSALPVALPHREWDWCQRLRRVLWELWRSGDLDVRALLQALGATDALRLALDEARNLSDGQRDIDRLVSELERSPTTGTAAQRQLVSEYQRWWRAFELW